MTEEEITTAWHTFASKLIAFADNCLTEANIKRTKDGPLSPEALAALLLIRTGSLFDTALLLLTKNKIVEARIMVRACVENLFCLSALVGDRIKFQKLLREDQAKSSSMKRKMILDHSLFSDTSMEARLRKQVDYLEQAFPKTRYLDLRGLAKIGEIESLYLLYSHLSNDAAHPLIDSLSRYVVHADRTWTITAEPEQVPFEIARTMYDACVALSGACVAFNEIVPVPARSQEQHLLHEEMILLRDKTGM